MHDFPSKSANATLKEWKVLHGRTHFGGSRVNVLIGSAANKLVLGVNLFMKKERQSTVSEKITAAAAVATAAAAAKTAAETTKARQEMEAMNRAMQLSAQKQERIQLAMASEQEETNFRNTVLTALPLLKNEQDKIQFLTEQFVPKLQNTEDDLIYYPVQWVKKAAQKDKAIGTYLESNAGKELKQFLPEGKDLLARNADWKVRFDAVEEAEEKIRKLRNPLRPVNLLKVFAWGFLFNLLFLIITDSGKGNIFTYAFCFGFLIQLILDISKIIKLKSNINKLCDATENRPELSDKEAQVLTNKLGLLEPKWKSLKSQLVNHLVEKYKSFTTDDARAMILACVEFKISDGVKDFQSFLPPSVRLPASHYAPFLFTEEDVERFKTEQKNIINLLEEQLEPDYENETVVWVGNGE